MCAFDQRKGLSPLMAVTCFINATPQAPSHGDTITATYTVTGNDPTPPQTAPLTGHVVVGGTGYDVTTTVTLPGTPAAQVTYDIPECGGLVFQVDPANPNVFTAAVP